MILTGGVVGFCLRPLVGPLPEEPRASPRDRHATGWENAEVLGRLVEAVEKLRADFKDAQPVDTALQTSHGEASLPVLLDTSDPEAAVRVLEEFTYRRERRWWKYNLDRVLEIARVNDEHLEGFREWKANLEGAASELRTVSDPDQLEAWVNKYWHCLSTNPAVLGTGNSLWNTWRGFRGEK